MYHFVINAHAKSRLGHGIWKNIERFLDKKEFSYKKYFTREVGHATKVARQITSGADTDITIVVLGGDGTLNEVLNGIRDVEQITLGYIPIGSSNDFARGMKLQKSYRMQIEKLMQPTKIIDLDYGVAIFGEKQKRFFVSSGMGFDAAVCHEVNRSKLKKLLNRFNFGKLTYGLIAVKQLLGIPYIDGTICLDDTKRIHYNKIFFSAVHVQKFEGGGFMFCPKADPTDGYLDLCVAENIPRWKALCILPFAKKGKHVKFPEIHTYRCKKAVFIMDKKQYVHVDGETKAHGQYSKVTFETSPKKIRFIAG